MVQARNLPGYSYNQDVPSGFHSWLEFWQHNRPLHRTYCRCCGSRTDLVGGHVEAVGYAGVYIVPLCKSCNHPDNRLAFPVDATELVQVKR